jgi:hypothetical protein
MRMKKMIQTISKKIYSNKIVASFLILASVTLIAGASVANAAPDYFAVAKPSSTSQCQGGTWKTINRWHWWHHHRIQVFVPNWQKLGFSSHMQCIHYVSTPQPTSKRECREESWHLGFNSDRQCLRYLKLNPVGGYGGNQ